MDKLISLVSRLEAAIRYLLSGAVISTIWTISLNDPWTILQLALSNQVLAGFCVALIGFTAFSIYRLLLWVIGDYIAWKCKASAPILFFEEGVSYPKPYTKFLRWRHSEDLPQSLSGYLTYRWSVAHFAVVSGLIGLLGTLAAQSNSVMVDLRCWVLPASLFVAAFGLWQISFLYRVERELCRDHKLTAATHEPD
jgi:hypothetical protein